MAIVPNTDVNLAGNIRDVLNAAGGSVTNDVITFFQTRANINMWAKYKPVRHTKKIRPYRRRISRRKVWLEHTSSRKL